VPYNLRFFLLCLSALFIYGIIRRENWTHEEMGIRHDNIRKSLPYYVFFTALSIAVLFLINRRINLPDIDTRIFFIKTLTLFLPISFFQEFAFRSFLVPRLKKIFTNNYWIIFVNAVLFTLIHIIYPNMGINLPITFVAGIFFTWIYLKYPNLLLVSLTHAAVNITAVLLGFFYIS
jgi:membrane protease YdiL (CAAX protease family)